MEVYSTKFKGLKIIKIKKFTDLRGNMIKILNKKKKYSNFNCFESYVSFSKKGAIRDLHGQKGKFSQKKLIYCLKGKAIDIAVDLRKIQNLFNENRNNRIEWICGEQSIFASFKNNKK